MVEEWRYVRNSRNYMVSNLGNVKRLECTIIRKDGKKYHMNEQYIKSSKYSCGYMLVVLGLDINRHKLVHRLVLETFNYVEGCENLQVNHIDGNKTNNHLNNLEWCTREENMQHALKNGIWKPQDRCGDKHPMSKVSSKEILEIKALLKEGKCTQHSIALKYDLSDTEICDIKRGKRWKNVN